MYTVVKYSNWMNELNFSTFTATDFNFFFALCAKAKDQKTETITFTFDELKKLTNYKFTGTARFIEDLKRMNKKLLSIDCIIDMEDKAGTLAQLNLFSTFLTRVNDKTLTVRVNPDFCFILNDLLSNYTKFDLSIFVSLESKYSKELFKHFKQWNSTGKVTFPVEELRKKLGAPVSYTNGKFYQLILEPSIKELRTKGCFKNLKCTINYSKQPGRPVKSYTFTWTKKIIDEPQSPDRLCEEIPVERRSFINENYLKEINNNPPEQSSNEGSVKVTQFF